MKDSQQGPEWETEEEIFADPHVRHTEKLPTRDEIAQYALRPDTSAQEPPALPKAAPANVFVDPDVEDEAELPDIDRQRARSGDTPSVPAPLPRFAVIPAPLKVISRWDIARDALAFACLFSVLISSYTWREVGYREIAVLITTVLALLSIPACYLAHGKMRPVPLRIARTIRYVGQLPLLVVTLGYIGYDLFRSLPVLFSPLPAGPPVGLSVGVALALAGTLLALETRGNEGMVPGERQKSLARATILVLTGLLTASLGVFLVMAVGRAVQGEPEYALAVFAHALVALAIAGVICVSAINRQPSWFVFSAAAGGLLLLGAVADNSLRLAYAAPSSYAINLVWLPWVCAVFAVMVSRSYVRTVKLTFGKSDWVLYALRTAEYSLLLHAVGFVAALILLVRSFLAGDGYTGLWIFTLLFLALAVYLSRYAHTAMLTFDADRARSHAVGAGVALFSAGFVFVIVHTVATQAAAGVITGGLALLVGIAIGLMLTVPVPILDEHGAPDLELMFADARRRWVLVVRDCGKGDCAEAQEEA
ncbi:DUF7937 domain-containing protein [Dermabacteraceae bacterium P13088]